MAHLLVYVKPTEAAEKSVDLPEDWDEMTQEERNEYCDEEAQEFAIHRVTYGYRVVE